MTTKNKIGWSAVAFAIAVFFTTQFLAAQIVGPPVFTPQMTVSPGFLTVTTGPTSVQDLTINGTCTGCVGAANFANPTGTIGLTTVNGSAVTGIRSDGAPALSQSIVPTWTGVHTFDAIPAFNGGASGVSQPFSVDSNTVVTNLNADMLDGISSASFGQLSATNAWSVANSFTDRNGISAGGSTPASAVQLGHSASGYGQIGNNVTFTANAGVFNYASTDTAALIDFTSGGIKLNSAASGTSGNPITFTQTASFTAASIALTATAATFNALPITTEEQGTFTASFGNACTTTPTITFDYTKVNNTVTLGAVSTTGFTCTGDSTGFSSGAIPANLRPTVAATSAVYANGGFQDNGVVTAGCLSIDGGTGILALSKFNGTVCNGTGWTASGNRSATIQNINFTYMLGNP